MSLSSSWCRSSTPTDRMETIQSIGFPLPRDTLGWIVAPLLGCNRWLTHELLFSSLDITLRQDVVTDVSCFPNRGHKFPAVPVFPVQQGGWPVTAAVPAHWPAHAGLNYSCSINVLANILTQMGVPHLSPSAVWCWFWLQLLVYQTSLTPLDAVTVSSCICW